MSLESIAQINNENFECVGCLTTLGDEGAENLYVCTTCEKEEIVCWTCGVKRHKKKGNHDFSYAVGVKKIDALREEELEIAKQQGQAGLLAMVGSFVAEKEEKTRQAMLRYFEACGAVEGSAVGIAQGIMDLGVDFWKGMKNVQQNATRTAGISAAIVVGIELAVITWKFWRGDIKSWQEYGKLFARSIASGIGAFAGNVAGCGAGAAIGFLCFGPVGACFGAVIGSIAGAIAGGAAVDAVFEKYWPNDEKKAQQAMLIEALSMFHFKQKDIEDAKVFNEKKIKDMYKELAKIVHPDRKNGSTEKFQALNMSLTILLGILDKKGIGKFTQHQVMETILAIEWHGINV